MSTRTSGTERIALRAPLPKRKAEDYRLLPGAVAVFVCTRSECGFVHRAELPDGMLAEVYLSECAKCFEDTSEIVEVEKEGSL